MTPADLEACFDQFRVSAFRLETLPAYDVGGMEADRREAWRAGRPIPERSVRTSPWLRRIALTTAEGKTWQRVRVISEPPTEYEQFELVSYAEALACGDETRIAVRSAHPDLADLRFDFWLFDAGRPGEFAVRLLYGPGGAWAGAERISGERELAACASIYDVALSHSVTLAEYTASLWAAA
jgi:hypothetical protein